MDNGQDTPGRVASLCPFYPLLGSGAPPGAATRSEGVVLAVRTYQVKHLRDTQGLRPHRFAVAPRVRVQRVSRPVGALGTSESWAATGQRRSRTCEVLRIPLRSRDPCCDTADSPRGRDGRPAPVLHRTPDRADERRVCVTARGRESRGGRLSSSVGAGHRCVRARWRAVACQSGHAWTCDGFGCRSRRVHRNDRVQRPHQPDRDPLLAGRPRVRGREERPHQGVRVAFRDDADRRGRPAHERPQLLGPWPPRDDPQSHVPDRSLHLCPVHLRPHPWKRRRRPAVGSRQRHLRFLPDPARLDCGWLCGIGPAVTAAALGEHAGRT